MAAVIRDARDGDLGLGLLEALDALRPASGMDAGRAAGILENIIRDPGHVLLVAELDGKIAGAITLLVEQKLIHDGARAGHIEDVAVARGMQGRGIGAQLVRAALERASEMGCYKTVLDCADDVLGFYSKLGFEETSHGMRHDHR